MTSDLLKRFVPTVALLLIVAACSTTAEVPVAASTDTPTRVQVASTEPTAVAAADPTVAVVESPTATAVPAPTATAVPAPTPTPEPTATPPRAAIADSDHSGLAGTRGLTLQWISWEPEDWGVVEFVPLVDGTYGVAGRQEALNGDYVSVDGTIMRTGDRELLFSGEVVVQLEFSNNGEPCVRSGDIVFLATGERQFWRMQDLLNCDGIITDYVDIYFG